MGDLVDRADTPLQRGITALRGALGEDAAVALLQPATNRADEAASYYLPLPVDYTGTERRVRIGFPRNFPCGGLRLSVEPSPWLMWPHATEVGLCLHGFQERPVMGTPEYVVSDSLDRLSRIVSLSRMGSCTAARNAEFRREITSYWARQQGLSLQNLILLNRPETASKLFALSDPRQALPSGQETVWLASDLPSLQRHCRRTIGRSPTIRAPEAPGFYAKLQSYPDLRLPAPELLLAWLIPHLTPVDSAQLLAWFNENGSQPSRWVALELPGDIGAPIYCLNIRAYGPQLNRGSKFYLRSARRRLAVAVSHPPILIRATTIDVLDRTEILSRDLSGVSQSLEGARVVCVGVGSLGSTVALQLARSGVGHLTLIDPDYLVSANLGRHVLGADDLGQAKAKALQQRIRKDLPTTEVAAYVNFAEIVMYKNPEVFDKADLVIVTTADWQSEVALWNSKSNGTSWSLVQAWSEPHTQVGHVLFAPPGPFDARSLFTENGDFRHKFTEWPENGVVALPACGESFIPGGCLGMVNIASMVSQTALRALSGDIENPIWVSNIHSPRAVATLGGKYLGPELPVGMQQAQLERHWPERQEGAS
ncbi:ThiF family adenylyltransferase [Achromobacter aegrifaciens]|uniref:ThiF family adenylyltransferase n=1 Tax=Achromobacter aegrifaciens TaxID=1287736 RepID=UPI0027BA46D2|nr:ThiF family adenylyltransferase [Achromobacter aegrifaciens]WLW62798.1 ThiF family adenylyltransferase [Achromobacter aegrifaciens]